MSDTEISYDELMDLCSSLVTVLRHYRTRVHIPASDGGNYYEIATWVNAQAVDCADSVLATAKNYGVSSKLNSW